MYKMKRLITSGCIIAAVCFGGCAGPITGHKYTPKELETIYKVGKYVHEEVKEAKK